MGNIEHSTSNVERRTTEIKNRVTMLPDRLKAGLQTHWERVRLWQERDLANGLCAVALPWVLQRK